MLLPDRVVPSLPVMVKLARIGPITGAPLSVACTEMLVTVAGIEYWAASSSELMLACVNA